MTQSLDRLIETEERVARAIADAEAAAAALVRDAREAVAEAEARYDDELRVAVEALARRIEAERDAEIATILADGERRARRFHEMSDAEVDELAALAESMLLGGGEAERG